MSLEDWVKIIGYVATGGENLGLAREKKTQSNNEKVRRAETSTRKRD